MRYAVPASLWHRPKPSVAWAFGGVKVHRTFTCYRLTHWRFILFHFAHGLFDPGPSLARALGALLRGAQFCSRQNCQFAGVAQGCAAYGAEDAKQKTRFLLCSIFQTLRCLKNVRCLSATAPALLYLPTSDRQGWWKCKGL